MSEGKRAVRIALIGTGGMGRKYAEMILADEIPGLCLSAMVCRSQAAREWAGEALEKMPSGKEAPKCFASADELFAEPELYDAVLVVTPHKTHPELAGKAFALKKHVLCDKPAGITAEDAADMRAAAKEAGVLFAMMFQQRTFPKYRAVRKILDEGQLGTVRRMFMETTRYFRTEYYHASGSWRSSWSGEGGGLLINQAQHPLDIWQFLFGLPETVYAEIPFGKYNSFAVDDEATLVMRYPDGATGTFIASTGEAEWMERLSISGSRGKLVLTDNTLELSLYEQDSDEYRKNAKVTDGRELAIKRTEQRFGPADSGRAYRTMLENFASAILEGTPLIAPGEAGEGALQLMCASYLSAWKRGPVSLPIDREEYRKYLHKAAETDL
ncbi:MAG: Gfo/Idh/MocA family oxidoreductase [Lachnospiraceae bacterium]|nr:Gfo/Idh/MocA family oxidoreductase [Lachnospiraceae bacterium]